VLLANMVGEGQWGPLLIEVLLANMVGEGQW